MPKSENQKLKILYILDYLQKNSHEAKPVRANELISMLAHQHGIACDRKTVYSDIAALQEYGVDIISLPGKSGGYYIGSRNFELPELKLLIDAVQSSRFLTQKKSAELIKKLCAQCNEDDARLLTRTVFVSGRVKSMNESIYYNVDAIQEAIGQNRQITFRYFDWDIGPTRSFRDRSYYASPYGLCQENENCYLLAYTERHGITAYRVDRMIGIELTDLPRIPCPELTGIALSEHASRLFQMYAGEITRVKLRFHRSLVSVVVDRFGKDTMLIPDGDSHFTFTVPVSVSPMFLSWVIGFGEKAEILYPDSVIAQCRALCMDAMSHYSDPPQHR